MANGLCRRSLVVVLVMGTVGSSGAATAGIRSDGFTNAATVADGIVFDELNVHPNVRRANDKPAIIGARMTDPKDPARPAIPVDLVVTKDRLSATHGTTIYRGLDLPGLIITTAMCDGRTYELYLAGVQDVPDGTPPAVSLVPASLSTFWAAPRDRLESYEFLVKKTSKRTPMAATACTGPVPPVDESQDGPADASGAPFKEHLCKGAYHSTDDLWTSYGFALAFEGDYFDPSKTVKAPSGQGWFNLACDGTAAAKMHLLRHTEAGSDSTHMTSADERTAMLKAITADYCGDGGLGAPAVAPRVWTADGTPLFWTDKKGWFPDPAERASALESIAEGSWFIEAIWGPNGAICLNEPRRKPNGTPVCPDPDKVPAVERDEVKAYCVQIGVRPPPRCSQTDIDQFLNPKTGARAGHVMTVNMDNRKDYCPL